MQTNHLQIDERIKRGKKKESLILDLLNEREVAAHGFTITAWTEATLDEDKHDKIDAWCLLSDGQCCSVQIKHREGSADLGIAVIRPWESDEYFCDSYLVDLVQWDRDMKNTPDFYVVYTGRRLCVISGKKVKKAVELMLARLYDNKGFRGHKGFDHPKYKGAELKLVRDKGAGYSAGQYKVICYLDLDMLGRVGAYLEVVNA